MSQLKHKKKNRKAIVILLILGFALGNSITRLFIDADGSEIQINIIYSSEKASWMTIAYNDFLEQWSESHEEKILLNMHPYGSSDSVISLLNGEIFPTIWSPASSIWIPFLNTKWKDAAAHSENIVDSEDVIRIIFSPIVIATWEEFNETYGLKSFQDLHSLCVDPSVDLKLAHTDPRLSNSGYMSVIMALAAASGIESENFDMDILTNETNQQWLSDLESRAVLYGKSTGFLSRYMKSSGPQALTVALLYENLVKDISSEAQGGKVIAVYPEEGTLYSDHPFCILDADWITEDQRMVAEEFLEFLNQTETVESAVQYGFRPIDNTIPLDPSVFNYETNGIQLDLDIPEMKPPVDGEVLLRIPDLWQLCKATTN